MWAKFKKIGQEKFPKKFLEKACFSDFQGYMD